MELIGQLLLCCVPVIFLALSGAVFSVALHCSDQRHRVYLLPFFFTFSVLSFTTCTHFGYFLPSLIGLWSLGVSLYILHIISLLYIEKWPAPRPQHQAANPNLRPWQNLDLRVTYKVWGNPQLLPASTATPTSPNDNSGPETSYSVFYFLRLVKLPIYYYVHVYLIPSIVSETIVGFFPEDVAPTQQTLLRRLHEVTAREIVLRGYTAVIWVWESIVFLDGANALLACFFVFVGLDQPSDWPALFGSLTSAMSLRAFWSKFWHRLAVRPYTNYGKLLARCLRLKPGSFAFKTVVAGVVFGLSGTSHSAVSWRLGHREWNLDMWWFFLNFLGCSVEVLCISRIRSFAKYVRLSRELKMVEESWFGRFVGYVWVFTFFFWSTPKWRYPITYRQAMEMRGWDVSLY
jgi:Membrane bound O-acyl transferase family